MRSTGSAFWVHGADGLGDGAGRWLAQAHPGWRFSEGGPPPSAAYQVLVDGRPSVALLAASTRLRTLVVPFAGIPAATAALLTAFPGVRVRTLHHTAGPTAELALGLVLAAARALLPADRAMRDGDWTPRFVPGEPAMVLEGHVATVVGYGHVGQRVAQGLAALRMRVKAVRASATIVTNDGVAEIHPTAHLRALLGQSRVVVLAVPAAPATDRLLGAQEIMMLPKPAVVVNVARASVVDEQALFERLRAGDLAAGLDVWWTEATGDGPTTGIAASRYPFHTLPNVVLSPHRGGGFSIPEVRRLRLAHLDRVLVELATSAACDASE
jgi:phosphoglycerate dehydrogenase-like enzyme